MIQIGKITRPHGFKGHCFAISISGDKSALSYLKEVFVGKNEGTAQLLKLLEANWMPKGWKLVLENIDTEEKADALRESVIFADRALLKETSKNEYYVADLEGCTAIDASTGKTVALFLASEEFSPGQSRWWFKRQDGSEFSVPAVKRYIASVDPIKKEISLSNLSDFEGDE